MAQPTPQPAKGALAMRRISNARIAHEYGCSAGYVGRVLNGQQKPSPEFRRFLSRFLHLPQSELFWREDEHVAVQL